MTNRYQTCLTLPVARFIEYLKDFTQNNSSACTLAYIEINNAIQVARLIQGVAAEERLIEAVEQLIMTYLNDYDYTQPVKIQHNQIAVVLKHGADEAFAILETLATLLDRQEVSIDDKTYYPKVMIGLTSLTPEYRNVELAVLAADEALYQARRTGNSLVRLLTADDARLHLYLDALKLLPQLRQGLLKKNLVLYAQPIVATTQVSVPLKSEILLRYQTAEGLIKPPLDYLRAAALFNVSREVDLYVLEQCCRFLQQHPSEHCYSINISGATVRYPAFFDEVKKTVEYYGIASEQLCFEITENVADQDYNQASLLMFRLKNELGCQLSLDDIGIGSSNLANLPKYDVDYLKIDGSFVRALLSEPYAEHVVKFIDTAAKLHGKQSVAEHIEQPLQLKKIQEIGVDFAQGYLTGKPEMLFDPALD